MGLFKKDLSSILAGFHRTIQQLDRLVDDNDTAIKFNNQVVESLETESKKLFVERDEARAVKAKLEALVTV